MCKRAFSGFSAGYCMDDHIMIIPSLEDACGLAMAEMCLASYPGVVRHLDTRLKCVLHSGNIHTCIVARRCTLIVKYHTSVRYTKELLTYYFC